MRTRITIIYEYAHYFRQACVTLGIDYEIFSEGLNEIVYTVETDEWSIDLFRLGQEYQSIIESKFH